MNDDGSEAVRNMPRSRWCGCVPIAKQWGETMLCTICMRDGHVAASCPDRPRFLDKAIAVLFAISVVAVIRFSWLRNLVT